MGKRKEEEKKTGFVYLNSEVTVRVYPGVFYENATQPDTRIGDRLKVIEKWSKYGVLIKAGSNVVSAEVAEWPTVKAMIEKKKMNVVGETDSTEDASALKSKEIAEEASKEEASLEKISEDEPEE